MNDLTISVVILTSDRSIDYFKRALSSIINQIRKPDELIVMDVGNDPLLSHDKESLMKQLINGLFLYSYDHSDNDPGSRNRAVEKCTGDYIAFLDDDDEWYPNKLEDQLKIAEDHSIIISGYDDDDFCDCPIPSIIPKSEDTILGENWIGCTSFPLISKKSFNEVHGFNENIPSNQEWELWIRLSKICKIIKTENKVGIKHKSPDMISNNLKRRRRGWMMLYKSHLREYLEHPDQLTKSLDYCYRDMFRLKAFLSSEIAFFLYGSSLIYRLIYKIVIG